MHSLLAPISVVCLLIGSGRWCLGLGEPTVELTGIVHFNDRARALIEITQPPPRAVMHRAILAQGDTFEGVTVLEVDEKAARVRLRHGSVETFLALGGADPEVAGRTFNLKAADSSQLLDVYQELSGSTVLLSPRLPGAKFDLKSERLAPGEALPYLQDAFRAKGIVLQSRGTKFVFAVRDSELARLVAIPDAPAPPAAGSETFPAGLMKFINADLSQLLDIYQELSGRTVLRSSKLSSAKVSFRTQTELNRAEAVWLMDAVLALADVAMIPQGEKFVFALAGLEAAQLPGIAAKPALAGPQDLNPLTPAEMTLKAVGLHDFLNLYARLIGREPLPLEPTTPSVKVSFRPQTPLTMSEAVYALQALAEINGLGFVPVGDKQVKVLPAANVRPEPKPSYP